MSITIIQGDCLAELRRMPEASVNCVGTSPPYNLDKPYNVHDDNMPEAAYLAWQGNVARALRQVVKPDGHVFLNVGWNSKHPWRSIDVLLAYRPFFELQNAIAWIKSLAIDATALPTDDLHTLPAIKAWMENVGLPTRGKEGKAKRQGLCEAIRYAPICMNERSVTPERLSPTTTSTWRGRTFGISRRADSLRSPSRPSG